MEQAKRLGYGAILFFGRPEYYPQFGFKEAAVYEIADSEGYIFLFLFVKSRFWDIGKFIMEPEIGKREKDILC